MVANDPLVVLRDLLDGSIDSGMVQALADYYPEFFKALTSPGGLVDDAIATMKANRGEDWDIDGDKDKLLQVLLQVQGVNLGLANDFARVAAIQPPPPTVSPKSKALTIETGEELPGQKSASSSA
jgi:hypothetical protein